MQLYSSSDSQRKDLLNDNKIWSQQPTKVDTLQWCSKGPLDSRYLASFFAAIWLDYLECLENRCRFNLPLVEGGKVPYLGTTRSSGFRKGSLAQTNFLSKGNGLPVGETVDSSCVADWSKSADRRKPNWISGESRLRFFIDEPILLDWNLLFVFCCYFLFNDWLPWLLFYNLGPLFGETRLVEPGLGSKSLLFCLS